MLETEEWVVRMSPAALEAALKLEHACEQRGLNSYDEAQVYMAGAQTEAEMELWSQVWEYVQVWLYAGWNDRILIDLAL